MPTADVVTDTIEHLDQPTPCTIGVVVQLRSQNDPATVGSEPCPNPAAWDMTCRRCGSTSPVCDPHKLVASLARVGHCRRCGKVGRPGRMFTFYRIGEP